MDNNDKKVSLYIALINIIVYFLYKIELFKEIPCQDDLISNIQRDFIHIKFTHLLLNLTGLYVLSNIEKIIGTDKFLKLLVFIIIITSLIETQFYNSYCSIGFSGILYALLAYQMLILKKIEVDVIIVLILLHFTQDGVTSNSFHLIGFLTGIAGYYVI